MKKLSLIFVILSFFIQNVFTQNYSPKLSFYIGSGVPIITPGQFLHNEMINHGLNQSITHDFYFFETTSYYPSKSASLPLQFGVVYLFPRSGALGVEFSTLNGNVRGHKNGTFLNITYKNWRLNPFYRFSSPDGNAYFQAGISMNATEDIQRISRVSSEDNVFQESNLQPGFSLGLGAKLLRYSALPSPGSNFLSKLTQGLNVGFNIDYHVIPLPQTTAPIYADWSHSAYPSVFFPKTRLLYQELKVGLNFNYVMRLKKIKK